MDEILAKSNFLQTLKDLGYTQEDAERGYKRLHTIFISTLLTKALNLLSDENKYELIKDVDVDNPDSVSHLILALNYKLDTNDIWRNKVKFLQECQKEALASFFQTSLIKK